MTILVTSCETLDKVRADFFGGPLKTNLVLLLTASLIATACTQQSNSPNAIESQNFDGIIGGEAATSTDPVTASTVSLMYTGFGVPTSFCSGTLISKNLILTATHCLQGMENSDIKVFFGEVLTGSADDLNLRNVKDMVTHPDYSFELEPNENVYTGFNDVGLILLEDEAPSFAKPVPVMNEVAINIGQQVLLAGYGLVNEMVTPPVTATGLNLTRVTIAKTFSNILVTEQSNANGACAGDSGGPAYLETEAGLIVLGITRGPHNLVQDCRHWGEYTYASRFKDYILTTAATLGADAPVFVDAPSSALVPPALAPFPAPGNIADAPEVPALSGL